MSQVVFLFVIINKSPLSCALVVIPFVKQAIIKLVNKSCSVVKQFMIIHI